MAIIPQPQPKRPKRRNPLTRLSKAGLALLIFAVAIVCFIGWQIFATSSSGQKGQGDLVQFGPDNKDTNSADEPDAPDSVPDGYQQYSNPALGFSFNYPTAWGALTDNGAGEGKLSLKTPDVTSYGLADALQVQVFNKETFQFIVNNQEVGISPKLNSSGTYDWIITDKGKGDDPVDRPYSPQPTVSYQSGKATIYTFIKTNANCSYTVQVFPVGDNFVTIRMPSFCVSSKPGDDSVQAQAKSDFDTVRDTVLRSITVL